MTSERLRYAPKCPACGSTWPAGDRYGHCAACCSTFAGIAAFDRHRVGKHGTPERRCELTAEHWRDALGRWHIGPRDAVPAHWAKAPRTGPLGGALTPITTTGGGPDDH